MEKFTKLTGVAAPMPLVNIDTDMIIPKQFLKTIKRTGLGANLFDEMRFDRDGNEIEDFVLNKPQYRDAQVLVAGDNFGCGSSREHAPWALLDFGIRCVISTSFADIFYNNCFKNGILPIVVSPEDHAKLMDDAERGSNAVLTVDLESQTITGPRRRRGGVRSGCLQEALSAERARRYRADHGKRRSFHRSVRSESERRATLGLKQISPQDVGPPGWAALFYGRIDAMSHHSDHEIAQKFIQLSGVIAVMSMPRQEWGKIMAVFQNWLFENKKTAIRHESDRSSMRQRQ